jgi:uncharacterized protein YvpB
MKLVEFAGANRRYESRAIAQDAELSQVVQDTLIERGLLAKTENPFGVKAMAALTRFQHKNGCNEPEFLGPQTAAKLIEVTEVGSRAAAPIISVEAIQNTVLKRRPLDLSALKDDEKSSFAAGAILMLTYAEPARKHLKLILSQDFNGSAVWYVLSGDVKITGGEELPVVAPIVDEQPPIARAEIPPTVKLDVPYKSQRDNALEPDGTCNVTSLTMCLEFLSIPRRQSDGQFEDELCAYALDNGLDRHEPAALAQIVQDYGGQDAFNSHSTINEVKGWLAAGNPAVTHGFFTGSGHIVVFVGYDETGFIVHDPYGEWYADGYDKNDPENYDVKGKFLHYSYSMIEQTCCTDGEFWVHFISK